ncbi:MAG TPA: hypothetical protein VM487_15115 [Phycisphaerae bacterium]|nr:hypothetical protein [Phycisphaerae bacterium]
MRQEGIPAGPGARKDSRTSGREQVRAELRSKLAAAMPYHGYIYHSDHSVPPGVTLETYRWLLDEVRRIGVYE